jgi:hypothetical protein
VYTPRACARALESVYTLARSVPIAFRAILAVDSSPATAVVRGASRGSSTAAGGGQLT